VIGLASQKIELRKCPGVWAANGLQEIPTSLSQLWPGWWVVGVVKMSENAKTTLMSLPVELAI
jgi:hypothetical protein